MHPARCAANVLMAVIAVGLPVGLLIFLIWAKRVGKLFSPKYRERVGTLYEVYQPKYYYYEVIVLLR